MPDFVYRNLHIDESVIHQSKLNIVTDLVILLLIPHEFIYSILLAHDQGRLIFVTQAMKHRYPPGGLCPN